MSSTSSGVLCDPDVVEHEPDDVTGRLLYRAICHDCGWQGPVRTWYGEAIPDADSHALESIR